jgi:diguanylate cyclase (GGDEF)-like protein/PAS domain S-box-containing protein
MRVLVVDDNDDDRLLVQKFLLSRGYSVVACEDGATAIDLARENHPDIVISDILMPGMDGFMLCSEIKCDENLCSVPVIFCTATFPDEEDRVLAEALGASRYLIKPVDFHQLLSVIHEVMSEPAPKPVHRDFSLASGDKNLFRLYSARVFRKLDQKISELKALNARLAETEKQWNMTFDAIADFVSIHTTDFRIMRINRAVADHLGLKPEEIVGRHCYDVFHGMKEPWPDCPQKLTLKTGRPATREVNDEQFGCPMLVSTSPVFDSDGGIKYAIHVGKNIEKQKRRQEVLRESEEKYRAISEMAADAIIVLDDRGRILEWNRAAEKMFGYAKDEMLGKDLHLTLARKSDHRTYMKGFEVFRQAGKGPVIGRKLEFTARKKNGTEFPIEVSTSSMNIRGKWHALGLIRDISERKRAEAELQRRQADLAILYRITSAIGRTIKLDKLLSIILETITDIYEFRIERRGGIFLLEGDRLRLVSHLGHTREFLDLHKNLRIGDCLCGMAARMGKVIISTDCDIDSGHTIRYRDMKRHGHIIVPLKVRDTVVGVLYLYMPADFSMSRHKVELLETAGRQIGLAIENARLYEAAKESSFHDHLTGLANRRFLDVMMERSYARALRTPGCFSVLMADIDHFKQFNDTRGHTEGDALLKDIASILRRETRDIDFIARYGGEEFLVILPDTGNLKAMDVAERIRKAVRVDTDVTISIGVATFDGKKQEPEDVISRADSALYMAKRLGRDRVEHA